MSTRPARFVMSAGARREPRGGSDDEPQVQRITSAPEAHSVDIDRRMARYAWQMGIRTACFIAAFFASGWLQWVLLGAAIVLPYIAVVMANNGAVSNGRVLDEVPSAAPQLDTGPSTPTSAGDPTTYVSGEEITGTPRAIGPGEPAGAGGDRDDDDPEGRAR